MATRDKKLPIIRLLEGIRNFGYTFESAILDIVDNSIVAEASEVKIYIESDETTTSNLITRIVIKDNGKGMSLDEIYNALFLGSPDSIYGENSLSKYGFGLKSAGLSLANNVEVISRKNVSEEWKKSRINWHIFEKENDYVVDENLSLDEDIKYIEDLEHGTVVIIDDLLEVNVSKATKAINRLKTEASVVFHRFMEEGLKIYVNNDELRPFDPLFCNEIVGKFSEYDGKTPKSFWDNDKVIPINTANKVKANVKAVVLPIPALFQVDGRRKEIEKKYHMSKDNVGFYIYRNKRLIKSGVTLGLVDRYHGCFHIRIRIDLESTSDPYINLDVKKTNLYFNEDFLEKLENKVNPFINRAKDLWVELQKTHSDGDKTEADILHSRSNKVLSGMKPLDCDPSTLEVKVVEKNIESQIEELRKEYPGDEDIVEQLRKKSKERVIAVDNLPNELLWQPYTKDDGTSETIVLLSREHPFYSKIYRYLEPGSDAIVILDALFLSMAMSELGISATDGSSFARVFKRLRQSVSFQLTNLCDIIIDSEIEDEDDEA